MHDYRKGRTISTEQALTQLSLLQFTYPRILFIGAGTLAREGFLQLLTFMNANKAKGWYKNLEEIHVVENYIARYDFATEAINSGYVANLTNYIVNYMSEMCNDQDNFPKLRLIDLRNNGYNLFDPTLPATLINACAGTLVLARM